MASHSTNPTVNISEILIAPATFWYVNTRIRKRKWKKHICKRCTVVYKYVEKYIENSIKSLLSVSTWVK